MEVKKERETEKKKEECRWNVSKTAAVRGGVSETSPRRQRSAVNTHTHVAKVWSKNKVPKKLISFKCSFRIKLYF